VTCLSMSASVLPLSLVNDKFHMIIAHSQPVSRMGSKLDYLGITVLITGSFFPSVYYGFYCFPHLQKVYWTMVPFD
jgi:adiponectin receptor